MIYDKVIHGFVVQKYAQNEDETYRCTEQEFVAEDAEERENDEGPVEEDDVTEEHFNMHMVQPVKEGEKDYYFLFVHGCVEPELNGPFETDDDRDAACKKLEKEEGEGEHAYFAVEVPKGADLSIDSWGGGFFEEGKD